MSYTAITSCDLKPCRYNIRLYTRSKISGSSSTSCFAFILPSLLKFPDPSTSGNLPFGRPASRAEGHRSEFTTIGACAHAQSKSHMLKTHIYVWSKTEEDRARNIGVAKRALEEFTDISKVLQPSPIVPNWHGVVTLLVPQTPLPQASVLLHSV